MCKEGTGEIRGELLRYIDQYRWGWGMARKLINRQFSGHFTEVELKRIYRELPLR